MSQDETIPSQQPLEEDNESLTPDEQARIERVQHDFMHNPAINCPITFNWQGTREQADRVSILIRIYGLLMREDRPGTSFDRLKAITFHHDYELALREAAGSDRAAPVPSKESGGFSTGMMVRAGEDVHIVMHESVALALASDDDEKSALAQHIVRHELCHVDDFEFKNTLIAKHPDHAAFIGFDSYFQPLVEALWDEFYANKYSFGSWSDPRTFLDLLRDILPGVRDEVNAAIRTYRTSSDLETLLKFASPKVKFIAQCMGYAAGTLAGMGTTLGDEAPDVQAVLMNFGLIDAWQSYFDALLELDAARPNWQSVLDLKKLIPGCVALYAGFGLHYRPKGEGAYIDIPMTPETDPMRVFV